MIELKNKSQEEKIQAFKDYLNDPNNEDPIMSLNLFNLIKYGNNWDQSFFEHPDIIFNSILEFINIKNGLKEELSIFCNRLLNIFYNCIYNCCKIITDEEVKPIPAIYKNILLQGDFLFMSELANEYKFTSFEDAVYESPFSVLVPMANKISIFNNLILSNMSTLQQSDVEEINHDNKKS